MKRYFAFAAFVVGLGVMLLAVQRPFQMDTKTFVSFYIAVIVLSYMAVIAAILIGCFAINLIYGAIYKRKIAKALVLLEEKRTEEYVAEMERLLQTAKGRPLQTLLRLNLSAGYCDMEQFDQAINILEGLPQELLMRMGRSAWMVRCVNMCVCYFQTGQNAKAMELYRAGEKDFAPFRETPQYGGVLAQLDMYAAIAEGQYEQAEEMLKNTRKTWADPRLEDGYRRLEKLLEAKRSGT